MSENTEQLASTPLTDELNSELFVRHEKYSPWGMLEHARKLERELATERAAREAATAECARLKDACDKFSNDELLQGDWRKRAEFAEARLAEMRDALHGLKSVAWWGHDTASVQGNDEFLKEWERAETVLTATTPSPILAEVERLRALVEQAGHVGYGTAVTLAIEKQQQRADSAEAQLQIAREDSKRLDWLESTKLEWRGHWGGGGGIGEPSSWQHPSAEWTVRRTVKDGIGKYPDELRQMTVRDAIDAAIAQITEKQ